MKRSDRRASPARTGTGAGPKRRGLRMLAALTAVLLIVLLLAAAGTLRERCPGVSAFVSSLLHVPFDLEAFLRAPPPYAGEAVTAVNGNRPLFSREELEGLRSIRFSELDALGRCGPASAYLGPETLPAEKRAPIGAVRPSGWHTVRYDGLIEDKYLYNRCHLIGYQLSGDNADPRNLITGTRYLNVSGMLPYENAVFDYIRSSGNHVLYRVTPVFSDDALLASGVLMEARSVEDGGAGIRFCVYAHNVQPGIVIDYLTGDSHAQGGEESPRPETLFPFSAEEGSPAADRSLPAPEGAPVYILNTNTRRFHDPSCPSVTEMNESNREYFYGTREEALERGYRPCGRCKP